MKFPLIEFPIHMFAFSSLSKTLIGEASDLGNRHLQRLYDDACDVGFAIEGHKSVVVFVMVDVIKDSDGDVAYWIYEPTAESKRFIPDCADVKVHIYND